MKFQVFQYPLPTDTHLVELNEFLSSHRITSVEKQIVRQTDSPLLVFIVEYVGGPATRIESRKSKVDYEKILNEVQFAVFNALRDYRKLVAEQDGVPVYTVFTNAQLAEIAQIDNPDPSSLAAIPGIGKSRIEKHGRDIIRLIVDLRGSESTGHGP